MNGLVTEAQSAPLSPKNQPGATHTQLQPPTTTDISDNSHASVPPEDLNPDAPLPSTISPSLLSPTESPPAPLRSPLAPTESDSAQKSTPIDSATVDKAPEELSGDEALDHVAVKEEVGVLLEPLNGQIELLEHTPDVGMGAAAAAGLIIEEPQEYLPDPDHELKRVKVYELIGSRWIDQGTAFCFGQFSEERNEALLVARSERDYNDIILSTAIRSNDVYQRQQDTLIVWTEPDGIDYALSFQDPDGCAEVWNFILEVQQHMHAMEDQTGAASSPLISSEQSLTTQTIIRSGHLPAPKLGIIGEIERAIKALARTQSLKERICEYIQQEDYLKSLIEVMHTAEDLESLENLHALCSLMQTILMLNDHSMYEHILEDDIFFGVVGMLEYDPDFPGHKANYREFLHHTAQFHQPIAMRDIAIQRKVHHTYRLQFLKDVVLARALDDSTFNVLNSLIIFNQIDIITHIQQDPHFLRDVVRLFVDEDMLTGGARRLNAQGQLVQGQMLPQQQQQSPQHMVISLNGNSDNLKTDVPMDVDPMPATSSPKPSNSTLPHVNGNGRIPNAATAKARSTSYAFAPPENLSEDEITLRRDVILLLQQLAIMGKNVQMPARLALFRTLVDRGILFAIQWALSLPEKEEVNKAMFTAAGEVLGAMLDHDLIGVRGHVLKQVVAIDKEREAKKKGADKAETVLEMACRIMAHSKDLSFQSQIGDALKVWMDLPPSDPVTGLNTPASQMPGPKPAVGRKDEPAIERFMEYFYKRNGCIDILMVPVMNLPTWQKCEDSVLPLAREETNRFVYLCDLLYNFIQQHLFRSHSHVMSSDILSRVATLFRAKDKHLRHSAFRIFRLLLKQNHQMSHQVVLKQGILKPILDLTLRESLRDNLLSCSCQEYFDLIRKENMKELLKACMTRHEAEVKKLAKSPLGSTRFELFIRRYEMNNAPPPEESSPNKVVEDRRWNGPGQNVDIEEEDYFNADDDENEAAAAAPQTVVPNSLFATLRQRKRRPGLASATTGYRPPLKTPQLGALVDYGDDDDESALSTDEPSAGTEAAPSVDASSPQPNPSRSPSPSPQVPSPVLPSSGPPPKRATKEDDDDNLETLVRTTRARSQSPSPNLGPMRPSEKRRRTDDDDADELDRFSKSAKKLDLGNQKERAKNGDDPPMKKMKVKLGAVGVAVASSPSPSPLSNGPSPTTPTPMTITSLPASEAGTKDGDTG